LARRKFGAIGQKAFKNILYICWLGLLDALEEQFWDEYQVDLLTNKGRLIIFLKAHKMLHVITSPKN